MNHTKELVRFYGYKHWTLEEVSRCFNVGKGLTNRPNSHTRNHKWHAIVKRLGLRVEVCFGPVTNDEACAWEIANIELEKTFTRCHAHDDDTDIGCNFKRGGEGGNGRKDSKETCEKRNSKIRGLKHSPELVEQNRLRQLEAQNRPEVVAKKKGRKREGIALENIKRANSTPEMKEMRSGENSSVAVAVANFDKKTF